MGQRQQHQSSHRGFYVLPQTDTTIRLAGTRARMMMGMCGTNDGNVTNDRIGFNNTYGATG